MKNTKRKCEIIEVVPNKGNKIGYVRAKDSEGEEHIFINNSINGIPYPLPKVGMVGNIEWRRSTYYGLWFWLVK